MFDFVFGRTLKALVLTLFGEDPVVLQNVNLNRVVSQVKIFILSLPLFYRFAFFLSLFLLEWSTPPFAWKFLPFSMMSLNQRVLYLERWQGSPFYWKRMLFKLISSPCLMCLFAEESLLREIGFGPSLKSRRVGHAKAH